MPLTPPAHRRRPVRAQRLSSQQQPAAGSSQRTEDEDDSDGEEEEAPAASTEPVTALQCFMCASAGHLPPPPGWPTLCAPRPSPRHLSLPRIARSGALQAGGIAFVLLLAARAVDSFFEGQPMPDAAVNYTAHNVTVLVQTIARGLVYLATFIFSANALGLSGASCALSRAWRLCCVHCDRAACVDAALNGSRLCCVRGPSCNPPCPLAAGSVHGSRSFVSTSRCPAPPCSLQLCR